MTRHNVATLVVIIYLSFVREFHAGGLVFLSDAKLLNHVQTNNSLL